MSKSVPKAPAESVALYEALLALRLPATEREAFLKRYETTLCEQYGVVMKEYVRVPASLLKNTPALAKYLDTSYRYACTLKAKPTTKKSPAKRASRHEGRPGK
jgi:TfoX/Sxy family transcriptional regulator of competence genes